MDECELNRMEGEGGRVVEGEVVGVEVEATPATPAEQEARVPTPREVAIKAFQAEWTAKHGSGLADFFLVTRALEDVQRQIINQLRNPPDNKIARILLAASASDALARVEADIVVAVGILLGNEGDEKIAAFLELARTHHEEFFALLSRFNADGSPKEAANDTDGVDTPPRVVLP